MDIVGEIVGILAFWVFGLICLALFFRPLRVQLPLALPAVSFTPQRRRDLLAPGGQPVQGDRSTPQRPDRLTPSEQLVLGEAAWRKKELNGEVRLTMKPLSKELVKRALAVAFLADEEAGLHQLDWVQRKVFLGIVTRTELWTIPHRHDSRWPAWSLERTLQQPVERSVYDSTHNWAGPDSSSPWSNAGREIEDWMVRRGVLERAVLRKDILGIITLTWSECVTDSVSPLDALPAQQSLEACRQLRPAVFKRLMKDIRRGVDAHQTSPDSGSDFG